MQMLPERLRTIWFDAAIIVLAWGIAAFPILAGHRFIPFDSIDAFFPQIEFVVSAILNGDSPWWNPHAFGGIPVLGDPQNLVFSLHTLAGLLAGDNFDLRTFDRITLLYPLLGGIALYAYGRAVGGSSLGAVLGAILFMVGGVASGRFQHVSQIISYAMLPLLLLAILHLARAPGYGRALLLGLLTGLFLLNPNQVVFLGIFVLGCFALLHAWQSPNPARFVGMATLAALVALALMLPMLSALLEFVGLSNRPAFALHDSANASLPPFAFSSLILPGLFGVSSGDRWWAITDISQDYLYIGVVPLLAMLIALALGRLTPPAILALPLAIAAAGYAMGTLGPLYPWMFEYVPGTSLFRRPADGAYALNFSLAILIAASTVEPRDLHPSHRARILAVTAIGILSFMTLYPALADFAADRGAIRDLAWVTLSGIARWTLVAVLLWKAGAWLRSGRGIRLMLPAIAVVAVLDLTLPARVSDAFLLSYEKRSLGLFYSPDSPERAANGRIAEFDDLNRLIREGVLIDGTPEYRFEIIGDELSYGFPVANLLPGSQGYNPIKIAEYERLFPSNFDYPPKTFSPEAPGYLHDWYRRIGLKLVLLPHYITQDNQKEFGTSGRIVADIRDSLASGGARLVKSGHIYDVWELPHPEPRLSLYRADTSLQTLPLADLLPRTPGDCRIARYRNTRIDIDCQTDTPAVVVLNDPVAPGWRTCANDQATPIVTAGGLLRAIRIAAGQTRIVFHYQPVPFMRQGGCPRILEQTAKVRGN